MRRQTMFNIHRSTTREPEANCAQEMSVRPSARARHNRQTATYRTNISKTRLAIQPRRVLLPMLLIVLTLLQIVLEWAPGVSFAQQHQQQLVALGNNNNKHQNQQQHHHHHHHQNSHQVEQRQQTKPVNVMLYGQEHNNNFNNLSSPLIRPLDRPSLNLVSGEAKHSTQAAAAARLDNRTALAANQQHFDGGALERGGKMSGIIEADWFMLGGPGDAAAAAGAVAPLAANDDLATSESRVHSGNSALLAAERNITSKRSTRRSAEISSRRRAQANKNKESSNSSRTVFDDEQSESSDSNETYDDVEESAISLAGTQKEPECAAHGRYYCTFKEDYPLKLVTEVTKYYKWPLEKLFRDLHAQIMPKLAQDSGGNLVCDSITRVVRPGWARNTNERWLVVINTENYHQYVTEVVCQYGSNSRCNFIPPCYYSSCQQRYNTQKLLVIDPTNPYRGPFLSEFLFPSCCVCYVPSSSETFQDKYRPSPATIYQRTMQQESAANLNPPQFRPSGLMEEAGSASASASASSFNAGGLAAPPLMGDKTASGSAPVGATSAAKLSAPEPGEIRRRGGEQYRRRNEQQQQNHHQETDQHGIAAMARQTAHHSAGAEFPRLGMADVALTMTNELAAVGKSDSASIQQ